MKMRLDPQEEAGTPTAAAGKVPFLTKYNKKNNRDTPPDWIWLKRRKDAGTFKGTENKKYHRRKL